MNTSPLSPPRIPHSNEAEVMHVELRVLKAAMEERGWERRQKVMPVMAEVGLVLTNGGHC